MVWLISIKRTLKKADRDIGRETGRETDRETGRKLGDRLKLMYRLSLSQRLPHHFLLAVFAPVLACSLLPFTAHAARYTFDTPEDYLAPAQAFAGWSATLERYHTQANMLTCTDPSQTRCPGRLKSYQRMLSKAVALTPEEQISLVNYYLNRARYDDDRIQRVYDEEGRKIGVQRNEWATLYEFLRRGGDCEDYAIAKYFMLRELGFPAHELRVLVTRERRVRGNHAVLAIDRGADGVWLLDSDNGIKKNHHRGFRFIYAMNEHHIWDHREDYEGWQGAKPTEHGSADKAATAGDGAVTAQR